MFEHHGPPRLFANDSLRFFFLKSLNSSVRDVDLEAVPQLATWWPAPLVATRPLYFMYFLYFNNLRFIIMFIFGSRQQPFRGMTMLCDPSYVIVPRELKL